MKTPKKLSKACKSLDHYGHVVGVNYQGNSAYQTKAGAFVSIVNLLIILLYVTVKLDMFWSR